MFTFLYDKGNLHLNNVNWCETSVVYVAVRLSLFGNRKLLTYSPLTSKSQKIDWYICVYIWDLRKWARNKEVLLELWYLFSFRRFQKIYLKKNHPPMKLSLLIRVHFGSVFLFRYFRWFAKKFYSITGSGKR